MPALCLHGRRVGGGEGEGGRGVVNQMWTGLDRGGVGVPKISKFVRTSFMDDP